MLQCGCHRKIFPWPNGSDQLSFWLVEPSKSEPYLNGIDARIRARYSGIGDMQVAHLRAPIISAAQKVNAESAGWGEIDMRSALRHLYVCKKCPASDLYIGHGVSVRSKIPFECKWIDGEPVCRIRSLCHDKKRNDINGIFKASTQKPGPMGIRQNPAVPCADIKHAITRLTPIRSMPSTCPDLKFMAAPLRPILRANGAGTGQENNPRQRSQFDHCKIS